MALSSPVQILQSFLVLLGEILSSPVIILQGNLKEMESAKCEKFLFSEHIHAKHHFTRQNFRQKLPTVKHFPPESMLAGVLTKPLEDKQFASIRAEISNLL